jgi:hypothetical protein
LFPSRWASLCPVRGRFLSLWRVPFPCPCKPFLKTLDFFCHWGSLPVLAVSCALSLKPFSVTTTPFATVNVFLSLRAPFLSLENPFVCHCGDFFSVTAGLFSTSVRLFSLSPQAPFPITASSLPCHLEFFPRHREFPSPSPRVLSPVTASSLPRHREFFPCHCELLSLSLRAQRSSLVSPQGRKGDCFENEKTTSQSRISTAFPQGERGRDCFANVKTSSQ